MGSITPSLAYSVSAPSLRSVGRYILCDTIASGGMAAVYLGRLLGPEGFSRTVAVKQLYAHFARDREFVTMFLDEARILSRIRHPHVVAPLDVISQDGELFIVMEYVHGCSLDDLMRASSGPIPPRIASAILGQVLLGLHAAHEATSEGGEPLGVVHRDVSPHNVLVGSDGLARVVDFGISKAKSRARTTDDGSIKGKLGYMAPEQLRSRAVDRRTDLFAAGTVLWEALAGKQLYAADNMAALLETLLRTDVARLSPLLGLPAEADDVLQRALALDPEERFATARDMAVALERALPAAGTLEVSEWVTALRGRELATRAERVLALESVAVADLTLARPRPRPRADTPALAAMPVVRRRRSPFWAGAASAGLLLGFCWAMAEEPKTNIVSRAAVPAAPAGAIPALTLTGLAPLQAPAPEFAPHAPSSNPAPIARARLARRSASVPDKATPVQLHGVADKAAPVELHSVSENVTPVEVHEDAVRLPRSAACTVPYTLDEDGVKRFKPECFP